MGQRVDLDTTYIKGGKNPREGTSFLRLKLLYILYYFLTSIDLIVGVQSTGMTPLFQWSHS